MNTNVKSTNLRLTEAHKNLIREKIASLEKFYPQILQADVEIEKTTNHHKKGDIYRAEVNLEIPNNPMVRSESRKESLEAAFTDVKNQLQRELREIKEKKVDKQKKQGLLRKEKESTARWEE